MIINIFFSLCSFPANDIISIEKKFVNILNDLKANK